MNSMTCILSLHFCCRDYLHIKTDETQLYYNVVHTPCAEFSPCSWIRGWKLSSDVAQWTEMSQSCALAVHAAASWSWAYVLSDPQCDSQQSPTHTVLHTVHFTAITTLRFSVQFWHYKINKSRSKSTSHKKVGQNQLLVLIKNFISLSSF